VKLRRLKLSQVVPRPIEEVFEFFADPCNLQRLTPAFLHFHFLREPPPLMQAGTMLHYRVRLYGVPLRWVTVIDEFESPYRFVDSQMRGPYTSWRHTHRFRGGLQGRDAHPRLDGIPDAARATRRGRA
jgi:ligand-binding SRPBCC domain-containing protein